MKICAPLILCCSLFAASQASATTWTFDLTGNGDHAVWQMDESTPLNFSTPFAAAYALVPMTINGVDTVRNIQFYTSGSNGGLDIFLGNESPAFVAAGPVLFEGSTASPSFLSGTFDLTGRYNTALSFVLTVSTAPVPEPATWALLAGGLAVVGGIARRKAPNAQA